MGERRVGGEFCRLEPPILKGREQDLSLQTQMVRSMWESPIGKIWIVADSEFLYFVGFEEEEIAIFPLGRTSPIESIEQELKTYFSVGLDRFTVPYQVVGTSFQQQVWRALGQIPFGKTCSYQHLAQRIGKSRAYRAVGNANGLNRLAIVVPCHRVILHSGALGGYAGGRERKQWLLEHERRR